MYSKIKFMAKSWSDLFNFYSKEIFSSAVFEENDEVLS